MTALKEKFKTHKATVVVLGVGYVGLPLAVAYAQEGFETIAFDIDSRKIDALRAGKSYIDDVPSSAVASLIESGKLTASSDPAVIERADAVLMCVPTPLNKTKAPDLKYVIAATRLIEQHQHSPMLVVLESTTYPGTTTEVLTARLSGGDYKLGEDIFIAFSPERVDPGNEQYNTRNTPKVIGGASEACLEAAMALYQPVIDTLVPVSSTDTAEMVKLLENSFRAVNIAMVNEFALMAQRLEVDIWEVIRAAATKPFGFMPFYPGPGLGGHCIPIDPLYLSWRMRTLKYQARFIELADVINSAMPERVVVLTQDALNGVKKSVNGSKVLVLGVAYKRDVSDTRESPAYAVIEGLQKLGAEVSYFDPHVPELESLQLRSEPSDVDFAAFDAALVVTDHRAFDYDKVLRQAPLIIDTRDALRNVTGDHSKVVKL